MSVQLDLAGVLNSSSLTLTLGPKRYSINFANNPGEIKTLVIWYSDIQGREYFTLNKIQISEFREREHGYEFNGSLIVTQEQDTSRFSLHFLHHDGKQAHFGLYNKKRFLLLSEFYNEAAKSFTYRIGDQTEIIPEGNDIAYRRENNFVAELVDATSSKPLPRKMNKDDFKNLKLFLIWFTEKDVSVQTTKLEIYDQEKKLRIFESRYSFLLKYIIYPMPERELTLSYMDDSFLVTTFKMRLKSSVSKIKVVESSGGIKEIASADFKQTTGLIKKEFDGKIRKAGTRVQVFEDHILFDIDPQNLFADFKFSKDQYKTQIHVDIAGHKTNQILETPDKFYSTTFSLKFYYVDNNSQLNELKLIPASTYKKFTYLAGEIQYSLEKVAEESDPSKWSISNNSAMFGSVDLQMFSESDSKSWIVTLGKCIDKEATFCAVLVNLNSFNVIHINSFKYPEMSFTTLERKVDLKHGGSIRFDFETSSFSAIFSLSEGVEDLTAVKQLSQTTSIIRRNEKQDALLKLNSFIMKSSQQKHYNFLLYNDEFFGKIELDMGLIELEMDNQSKLLSFHSPVMPNYSTFTVIKSSPEQKCEEVKTFLTEIVENNYSKISVLFVKPKDIVLKESLAFSNINEGSGVVVLKNNGPLEDLWKDRFFLSPLENFCETSSKLLMFHLTPKKMVFFKQNNVDTVTFEFPKNVFIWNALTHSFNNQPELRLSSYDDIMKGYVKEESSELTNALFTGKGTIVASAPDRLLKWTIKSGRRII